MRKRHLADWISSYLEYVHESEPPTQFHLWTAISVIASALQRKCWLQWDLPSYPNMYIVLVGPSGCRKGVAMDFGRRMLDSIGVNLASDSITREALIMELEEAGGNSPTEGTQIYHSSLTVYSPELTVFLGYDNKQLVIDMTDWYDCRDPWRYTTKTSGKNYIKAVWVNLLGATTPTLLQATMTNDAIGGGLTSRMIFVYAAKKGKNIAFPFMVDFNNDLKNKLIEDLITISLLSGMFRYDNEFLNAWAKFYNDPRSHTVFSDDRFEGYMQRRAKHILKLCMILSASRSNEMTIRACDLERAIKYISAAERNMLQAFAGVGQSDISGLTQRVMAVCLSVDRIKYSDLLSRYYADADANTMNRVVETLRRINIVKTERIPGELDYWLITTKPEKEEDYAIQDI